MILQGGLARLRPAEAGDLEPCYRWLNDEEILGRIGFLFPCTSDQARRWLEGGMGGTDTQRHFTVLGPQPVGFAGLRGIDWQSRHAEIWIALGDKGSWGRGLGTDAVRTLSRFAFEELGLRRLWAEVFAYNDAARRMFARVGFQAEGTWRQTFFHQGKFHDSILMGILREELRP